MGTVILSPYKNNFNPFQIIIKFAICKNKLITKDKTNKKFPG